MFDGINSQIWHLKCQKYRIWAITWILVVVFSQFNSITNKSINCDLFFDFDLGTVVLENHTFRYFGLNRVEYWLRLAGEF